MVWESGRSSHVPPRVRVAMLERDGYQCTARLVTGERCPATERLEAHEPDGWWEGKVVTVMDVITLCHWHHNRETQRQAAQARRRKPPPPAKKPRPRHPGLR